MLSRSILRIPFKCSNKWNGAIDQRYEEVSIGFRPKLLDTLKTYSRADFHADVVAGITVEYRWRCRWPWRLPFASGVPPQAGIFHGGHRGDFGFGFGRDAGFHWRADGRVYCHPLRDLREVRGGESCHLHDHGGRAAFDHGRGPVGDDDQICAVSGHGGIYQRHCGSYFQHPDQGLCRIDGGQDAFGFRRKDGGADCEFPHFSMADVASGRRLARDYQALAEPMAATRPRLPSSRWW